MATKETCEKINCTLEPGHEGWHVKKTAKGKVIIKWLDGKWESADGHGTYCYVEKAEVAVIQDMEVPQFPPYTGGDAA